MRTDRLPVLYPFILCVLCKELYYETVGAELSSVLREVSHSPCLVWGTDLHTMQGWEAPAGPNITVYPDELVKSRYAV